MDYVLVIANVKILKQYKNIHSAQTSEASK